MTLNELKTNERARILSVGGCGGLRRRLLDMGLTPGTVVKMRKVAPLGDPMEISLRGYEFTMRREDASRIIIEALSEGDNNSYAIRACGKPELRQDNTVQPAYGQQPACGQLSGGHRRKKRRRGQKA